MLWAVLAVVVVGLAGVGAYSRWAPRRLVTPGERGSYQALSIANQAAPALRGGLTPDAMGRALGPLRSLLSNSGVLVGDDGGVIASDGVDAEHCKLLEEAVRFVMKAGRPQLLSGDELRCDHPGSCGLNAGVAVPLLVDGHVVGALVAVDSSASPGLLRLCGEVGKFVSTQLELAELDLSRRRAVQAELQFLRAQISPHFVYNALTAIESFIRTDPDRARELLVSFSEFTRYSFASHAQYTNLADELRLVDIYLELERARFGARLGVTLKVAPEVLSVRIPSLILQPVVENAVRHGIEPKGKGRIRIEAVDTGATALISVEDDGDGVDPRHLERALSGVTTSVGLHNVDERLRATFGDEHGLVIETAPGAGTKVSFSVPKFWSASGRSVSAQSRAVTT